MQVPNDYNNIPDLNSLSPEDLQKAEKKLKTILIAYILQQMSGKTPSDGSSKDLSIADVLKS